MKEEGGRRGALVFKRSGGRLCSLFRIGWRSLRSNGSYGNFCSRKLLEESLSHNMQDGFGGIG